MKKSIVLLGLVVLAVSACTTPGKNTAIGAGAGAAVGAVAGAVITHNTGGKSTEGAIYGALAGAAAGGLIGNYYDKQAKELAAIADVTKLPDGKGIKVTLKNDILFATGSSALSPAADKTISDLSKVLAKYPENIIVVEGHTDSTGDAAANMTLSEKRAKAVYDKMLSNNVKTYSLTYKGYGKTMPVADNTTAEGKAKNRRVNLDITANTELVKQNRS